jgi:dihydrofolate reductase
VSGPQAPSRIELVLVAAVAENGVIGESGALPWRLKSEMRNFRTVTWGKPVVVGRTTYLSFTKRPLPGRTNIVVSRNPDFAAPGAVVCSSLEAALAAARGDALRRAVDMITVVGLADRLVISRVHLQPAGDAKFPTIDPDVWREVARTEHRAGPDDEADFTVLVYVRPIAAGKSGMVGINRISRHVR